MIMVTLAGVSYEVSVYPRIVQHNCSLTIALREIVNCAVAQHRLQIKPLLIFRNCVQSYDVCFDDLDTRPKVLKEALIMKLNL